MDSLCVSSGGSKIMSFLGALQYFIENQDFDPSKIKEFAGSSAGAFIVSNLAIGYTVKELYNEIHVADISQFKDFNMFQLHKDYGLMKGQEMYKFIKSTFKKKMSLKTTFEDLYKEKGITLTINGTCVNTHSTEYFNHKLTPKMKIIHAIKISCSVPIVFAAEKYKKKVYVDGGLLDPFPIHCIQSLSCLGIRSYKIKHQKEYEINNLEDFLYHLGLCTLNRINGEKPVTHHTVIDVGSITSSNIRFDMSNQDRWKLFHHGYNEAQNQCLNEFKEIISKRTHLASSSPDKDSTLNKTIEEPLS